MSSAPPTPAPGPRQPFAPHPGSTNFATTDATTRAAGTRAAGTFVLSAAWVVALLLVSIVLIHIAPGPHAPVAQASIRLVLSFAGLYWIALRRVPNLRPLSAIGFVRRPSQWRELGLGLALGWAIAAALVLPILLTRNLHTLLAFDAAHLAQTVESLLLQILLAIGIPLVFSGLVFHSLARATSPVIAAFSVALVSAALVLFSPGHDGGMASFAAIASLLFSAAALRTRALWLPIGLQAGWGIALAVFFGVGSFYWPAASGIVTSYVTGPRILTGSVWGPEASLWGTLVVLAGLVAVFRLTRNYAWHYTHDPIVPAGYPMDVAPPAEHTRLEAQAAPLVQILGTPAAPTSTQTASPNIEPEPNA